MRLALVVEYDSRRYAGSQRQKDQPTIQSELESALEKLTGERLRVALASRTDAGVHARGQVASFKTASGLPLKAFVHGLNHHLPADIAVRSARFTNDNFDPRRQALRREYQYCILTSATRSPLWNGRAYRLPGELDVDAMNRAAGLLVGEHDLASFASALEVGKATVCRVYRAGVRREGEMVIFTMLARSFLPHQVRNTVGSLIRVGQGRLSLLEFESIMRARKPGLAGPSAPAYGLYLNRVDYAISFEEDDNENL